MSWTRFDWDRPQTWPKLNRLVYVWAVELRQGEERDEETIVVVAAALMEDDSSWWDTRGWCFDGDALSPLAHPIARESKRAVEIWWHELPEHPDGRR